MRPRGSARRGAAARGARVGTASRPLLPRQLEVHVLERPPVHLEAFQLDPVGQRLPGQLVQDARRLLRVDDDLVSVPAEADLDGGVGREEVPRRAGADDVAPGEDRHAIGEALCLLHVVRRQQDALAERAQVADCLPGLPSRGGVEAGGGLVEEDELRVADEREREVEAAELAAGQRANALVPLPRQAHELDDLRRAPRRRVVAGEELDDLPDGEQVVDGGGLEDDADPRAKVAACASRILPEHTHLAGVSLAVALQDLHRRRLARPVRAEKREDLAGPDLEGDAVENLPRAVGLAEAGDPDRGHRRIPATPAGGNSGSGSPVRAAAIWPQSGWWPTTTMISPPSRAASATAVAVAPGASRSSGRARTPSSRARRSPVSRARRSGLVRIASGRTPSSRRRMPSERACSRPSAVSGRSSSGTPWAASAWRTR